MKHFLVTGAGSGIGAEVARELHRRGDRLWLVARTAQRGQELQDELPGAHALVADLASLTGAELAAWALPERLDGLVHSAGVVALAPVDGVDLSDLRHQLEVNLVAPLALTKAALPALRSGGGTVVFVNSGAGQRASAGWAGYAASKFGLRAVADSLRQEEAQHGVRVTTVFPGRTATPMQAAVRRAEGVAYVPEEFLRASEVARLVLSALDLPPGSTMPELSIRPG